MCELHWSHSCKVLQYLRGGLGLFLGYLLFSLLVRLFVLVILGGGLNLVVLFAKRRSTHMDSRNAVPESQLTVSIASPSAIAFSCSRAFARALARAVVERTAVLTFSTVSFLGGS